MTNKLPVAFTADDLAGDGLKEVPHLTARTVGNPREIIAQSDEAPKNRTLFAGDVMVVIYEGGPGCVRLENTLYDEYIEVLSGTLVLTEEASGTVTEVTTGGHVMVPKGYCGTFEMQGQPYRELVVSETKTLLEDVNAD